MNENSKLVSALMEPKYIEKIEKFCKDYYNKKTNMNENLKLISARIEPRTIEKIEEFCKNHHYWKRNSVINGILTAVFDHFEDGDIYDMVRSWNPKDDIVDCRYKIQRNWKLQP